jgi:hypothetical protein
VPLAYHSIFNLCEYPKSIISKRQKMSFKLPFGCGWLGSGCFGLRFRFGNPCGFIVLRYYYLSSFNTISIVIISFTPTTRQCRRFASLTAALRIPHATHPLPLSFEKERGDMYYSTYHCSPSLIHLERGNKKGVSKNSASLTHSTKFVGGYLPC